MCGPVNYLQMEADIKALTSADDHFLREALVVRRDVLTVRLPMLALPTILLSKRILNDREGASVRVGNGDDSYSKAEQLIDILRKKDLSVIKDFLLELLSNEELHGYREIASTVMDGIRELKSRGIAGMEAATKEKLNTFDDVKKVRTTTEEMMKDLARISDIEVFRDSLSSTSLFKAEVILADMRDLKNFILKMEQEFTNVLEESDTIMSHSPVNRRESSTFVALGTCFIPDREISVLKENYGGSERIRVVDYKSLKYIAKDVSLDLLKPDKRPLIYFIRESRQWARLSHPNIVSITGFWRRRKASIDQLAFIREFFPMSLGEFLLRASKDSTPIELKRTILVDVCQAMKYLQNQDPPIMHRDLKTESIYLTRSFRAKVSGLSHAKYCSSDDKLTKLVSSPYLPLETSALQEYDASIDCFSFGCIILETISHKVPNPLERPQMNEFEKRQYITKEFNDEEKVEFTPIIKRCLCDNSKERPSFDSIYENLTEKKTCSDEDVMKLLSNSFKINLSSKPTETELVPPETLSAATVSPKQTDSPKSDHPAAGDMNFWIISILIIIIAVLFFLVIYK